MLYNGENWTFNAELIQNNILEEWISIQLDNY
jgi:hypothetical protein